MGKKTTSVLALLAMGLIFSGVYGFSIYVAVKVIKFAWMGTW